MNIGEMQRLLSLKAEKELNHKFSNLYSLVCREDWLRLACEYVAQNAGSKTAGCDGIVMSEFAENLDWNLERLGQALQAETFVASPVRRVYIPKSENKVRPLGIPSIRDRIVQEVIRMILEPIYEAVFSQRSYGFRPNRCTMDAMRWIYLATLEHKKYFWVIEGDIASYFDTIHHRKLIKLLRRKIEDEQLLDLIWKFLRAGVMERKLFKDTKLGTPQGGIISPLLANVYLHELDKHMEQWTELSRGKRQYRREKGEANFTYVRYADDFVILCNGTKVQAEEMRDEVRDFLAKELRLTLSMEKTKVTHLNDGFDFLGFNVKRSMCTKGMGSRTTVSEKGMKRHADNIRAALSPSTHNDSVSLKIKALSRIIAGWCRYYQYTSKTGKQFSELQQVTFWEMAHWLGRKFKAKMPQVMKQFYDGKHIGEGNLKLVNHTDFKCKRYRKRTSKPNPYTTREVIEREELLDQSPWLGYENRPGWYDIVQQVRERDKWTCRMCGTTGLTPESCEVDHIVLYASYKRPVDANKLENCWLLCVPCHKRKTESDRQRESRVQ